MNAADIAIGIVGGGLALFLLSVFSLVALNRWAVWKQAKLWEQMTPEQRLSIRFREMAEAIRNNR